MIYFLLSLIVLFFVILAFIGLLAVLGWILQWMNRRGL